MITLQADQHDYSPAEMAAFLQVQELLAQVDAIFGVTGEPYFLDPATVTPVAEDTPTDLELDAIKQVADLLARVDNPDNFRPVEDSPALIYTMDTLFAEHDPLLAFAEPEND